MKKMIIIVSSLLLFSLLLSCCTNQEGKQATGSNTQSLQKVEQLLVYGEHSQLLLLDQQSGEIFQPASLVLLHRLDEQSPVSELRLLIDGPINQGLNLANLEQGSYYFLYQEQIIGAEDFPPLEGYTLPRDGIRKHWLFSEQSGCLQLTVEQASELPSGWADVFIDVGHGGEDTGAAAFGYIEAEENLTVSLYMKKLLEEQGLTVRLSREEMNIAGGEDAENNPYLSQARIDALYSCHASYLISNHLNGGSGRQSGWQIYSSVRADTAWAEKIAARWQELGWHHNNSNHGLVKNGIYQRWARDNAHSGRDYYFILRETGGLATGSSRYRVHHDHMASQLRRGAEGILLEYLFLDNRHDMDYWRENYRLLAEAAVAGCYDYWQLEL